MAKERKQFKSRPRLLMMIAATAGISNMVDELREPLEEGISASEQPGDGIIHDHLRCVAKTLL